MEALEEPPIPNSSVENVKVNVSCAENDEKESAEAPMEMDVCHKSNGVPEASDTTETAAVTVNNDTVNISVVVTEPTENNIEVTAQADPTSQVSPTTDTTPEPEPEPDTTSAPIENSSVDEELPKAEEPSSTAANEASDIKIEESEVPAANVIESTVEHVTFQTEILVESNDHEIIETIYDDNAKPNEEHSNILSELGESLELSEALRSSDVTDNVENNNCTARQEVFNKEELLDILEGNNEEHPTTNLLPGKYQSIDKILEAQVALQQLSQLKSKSKGRRSHSLERGPRRKPEKKIIKDKSIISKTSTAVVSHVAPEVEPETASEVKLEENIVNDLVKEWDDEDGTEVEKCNKSIKESENSQESAAKQDEASVRMSIDSQTDEKSASNNKSGDEGKPQKRLGRVIKKKVIFDPDNPDTFTKTKVIKKEFKEQAQETDQTPTKKIKPDQGFQRSKSKSPLSKLQWKKPSPKNNKQNKRLTEVDKLLMDEGAVNMIYQLTPEAPKGKKNMKTKAEFIKKIQSSSTPDIKEMKFRERKKDSKEDNEARRILGGKHRSSLSSSVKSPAVSEDFEAHSADDSIIYRRHSSSSYSSSCMSPRRLSDVEMNSQPTRHSQVADGQNQTNSEVNSPRPTVEIFMADTTEVANPDTINKDDCLSIKEKLNLKLNLALNKRKRETPKGEKPNKQKKIMKTDENNSNSEELKYLKFDIDKKLAIIGVKKPGSICNLEIIKELENVLKTIDTKTDISVTLFTPECGVTFSDIDLRLLLVDNIETQRKSAYDLAESIRSLLHTVDQHSKLLCAGASCRVSGVALALLALSDVALASERASVAAARRAAPAEPGLSVLTASRLMPQSIINDLLVLGRRLSAAEALQTGIVGRVLWPEKFEEQVLTIAKDIADQPAQNIRLKKQLLNLKKISVESTFPKCLEKERDLFVEFWCSDEGQQQLRATYSVA